MTDQIEAAAATVEEPPGEVDPLRAALLADPELPEEVRGRLAGIAGEAEFAGAWREAVVEQAAERRAEAIREELREQIAEEQAEELDRIREAQPRPTDMLMGQPDSEPEPQSPREWADWIHETDDPFEQDARRDRFTEWLRRNPSR